MVGKKKDAKQAKVIFETIDTPSTLDENTYLPDPSIQSYYMKLFKYPRSPRIVIESLIDKINQNIKEGQYKLGNTVLIIDLSDQLPIISEPYESIQENYFSSIVDGYISGELWHVAFGKVGSKITKIIDFEGSGNNDGILQKEGILISHPYIKGILFHTAGNLYGISKLTKDNLDVVNCLKYISTDSVAQ